RPARAGRGAGGADPVHLAAHQPLRPEAGRRGQPGRRHDREIRDELSAARGLCRCTGEVTAGPAFAEEVDMPFDTVEDAIRDIRDGKLVIVADDEDRENEGDLVCAASKITPELVNFMATHGR